MLYLSGGSKELFHSNFLFNIFKFRMFEETSKQGVQDECLLVPKSVESWSNMSVYSIPSHYQWWFQK